VIYDETELYEEMRRKIKNSHSHYQNFV